MHASNNILEWADKLTVFNLSAEDKPHDIIGMSTVNQLGLPYSRVTQHNGTVTPPTGLVAYIVSLIARYTEEELQPSLKKADHTAYNVRYRPIAAEPSCRTCPVWTLE